MAESDFKLAETLAKQRFESFKEDFYKTNSVLKYDRKTYYPSRLEAGVLSVKEMRAEYSRLRKIANKRLQRLTKAKYYKREADTLPFETLLDLRDEDLPYELARLAKFITSPTSSVRYWRARQQYEAAVSRRVSEERTERSEYADWLREHAKKMQDEDYYVGQTKFFEWIEENLSRHQYDSEIIQVMYSDLRARSIHWTELIGSSVLTRTYQRMGADKKLSFRNALFKEFYDMYVPNEEGQVLARHIGKTENFNDFKAEVESLKGRRLVTVSSYNKYYRRV